MESATYNARLQPYYIAAGTTGQGASGNCVTAEGTATDWSLLKLTYDYGTSSNNGNVGKQTIDVPGRSFVQEFFYTDGLNRLTSAREGTAWSRDFGYDAYGNQWVKAHTGPLSSLTPIEQTWFDAATNRLTATGYDGAGNLTGVGTYSFAPDAENRQTRATQTVDGTPSGLTGYTYDSNGNLRTKVDARGSVTAFEPYDSLNRPTRKSYSDPTPPVNWCYDGQAYSSGNCAGQLVSGEKGWLTAVASSVSATAFSHDQLGRVTTSSQTTGGVAYPFSYDYNLADGLRRLAYPSGNVVSYTYDGAGRPQTVRKGEATSSVKYADNITYQPHGPLAAAQMGNGVVESRSDNNRLQPWVISAVKDGVTLLSLTNNYGTSSNNGNVLSHTIQPLGVTQNFSYDNVNRLTSMSEGSCTRGQGYDQWGNQWVNANLCFPLSPLTPLTQSWFSPATNRLNGPVYDAAGNQTQVDPFTMSYDAENRQVSATMTVLGTPYTDSYFYDGQGRRVKKLVSTGSSTVTTIFVYDANGDLAAEYGSPADTGTRYWTVDHLGSTRLVTKASGSATTACEPSSIVATRHDYLPFGEEIPTGVGGRSGPCYGQPGPTMKFTGKERDAETGLDYFGARYLSGAQGRFTSPDPTFMTRQRISDPQQWNLYAYVRNNPLMYVDPDGKELKLAIYNSSGLSRNVATRVADRIAATYRGAGVKNVTYTLLEGRPSAATAIMYGLGPTPHSHLLEIRPSRAGSPAIRSGEGGHNWDFGGHSAVDTSVVTNKANSPTQVEVGIANVAAHEIGHDRLGHVDSPTNIMNSTGAADPNWLFNPSLMFTPAQAQILQNQYNRPGEVDITPPPPPPPPPPRKFEEEKKREQQ